MANKLQIAKYVGILVVCLTLGILAGFNPLAGHVDHNAYDFLLAHQSDTWTPRSVIVKIDAATLEAGHGMRNIRTILAQALDDLAQAQPKAVALDVTLHDQVDPAEDARLEGSLRATRNLVLPCQLTGGHWEDPAPRFRTLGTLGHVHTERERVDAVSRQNILDQLAGDERRWAVPPRDLLRSRCAGHPKRAPGDVRDGWVA